MFVEFTYSQRTLNSRFPLPFEHLKRVRKTANVLEVLLSTVEHWPNIRSELALDETRLGEIEVPQYRPLYRERINEWNAHWPTLWRPYELYERCIRLIAHCAAQRRPLIDFRMM
jgi:hypothetical protein